MGVSLSRYYQLEGRALKGLLAAMEPKKRGFQRTPQHEIKALQAEEKHLEQEPRRHQSLLRAARRSLELAKGGRPKTSSEGRSRKRRDRGRTVLMTLRRGLEEEKGATDWKAKLDGNVGGADTSERNGA